MKRCLSHRLSHRKSVAVRVVPCPTTLIVGQWDKHCANWDRKKNAPHRKRGRDNCRSWRCVVGWGVFALSCSHSKMATFSRTPVEERTPNNHGTFGLDCCLFIQYSCPQLIRYQSVRGEIQGFQAVYWPGLTDWANQVARNQWFGPQQ